MHVQGVPKALVTGLACFATLCSVATAGPDSVIPASGPVPPPIEVSAIVEAPVEEVWKAWTTSEGIPTFMGFGAEVDARPRGVFRVIFNVDKSALLDRGNDGIIVAIEPMSMLSVLWMTPMNMPNLRGNSTSLMIYFQKIDDGKRTLVRIVNAGYGLGPDWAAAYQYNVRGWDRVLQGLQYRFKTGPIDWKWAMEEFRKTGAFPWWRKKAA